MNTSYSISYKKKPEFHGEMIDFSLGIEMYKINQKYFIVLDNQFEKDSIHGRRMLLVSYCSCNELPQI